METARELGVPDKRICTIAAQVEGVPAANGATATPSDLAELARLVATGEIRMPIAATFPVDKIREATELQAARHVRGKIVIAL
ncbi:zinc-binding dehydrogenase [Nonomuraea salmonea]|uniref:zinc-binding dehydrogenase n=1 Tax=Nonomuraea salmonea TaxID=46181 RepID=UPI002FED9358